MLISLPNAFGDAATNMAIDAVLLDSIPKGLAAFRHYAWTEPAATFGYAQKYSEVVACELARANEVAQACEARASSHATFIRRLTGGGIVDHRNDWTYALILEASLPIASIQATELYERIHRAISQTIATQNIENQLAPCPRHCDDVTTKTDTPDQCFVKPAANDVLRADGQKIAGAAMKRNRSGLLIQGSIDRSALPDNFDFERFQKDLIKEFSIALEIPLGELEDIRPLFHSERIQNHKEHFQSEEWNQRR